MEYDCRPGGGKNNFTQPRDRKKMFFSRHSNIEKCIAKACESIIQSKVCSTTQ
jgi:hypothetical protein